MQRRTPELQLIKTQLAEAKRLHAEAEAARAAIEQADRTELERAWQCGKRLNLLKENIGHGNWETWISNHWPELPGSTRRLYMKIDNENPNCQRVGDLKHDSIRAYAVAKVPRKVHPKQDGEVVFEKPKHHSTVANECDRFVQRVETKQVDLDEDEARRDFERFYRWLQVLFGDA